MVPKGQPRTPVRPRRPGPPSAAQRGISNAALMRQRSGAANGFAISQLGGSGTGDCGMGSVDVLRNKAEEYLEKARAAAIGNVSGFSSCRPTIISSVLKRQKPNS